jgi:hypothetical protein
VVTFIGLAGGAFLLSTPELRQRVIDDYGIDGVAPLIAIGALAAVICAVMRPARGFMAYALTLVAVLAIVGFWINPAIDRVRSGAGFVRRVETAVPAGRELGLVGYKEQYLLQLRRPITNFGHARWREGDQEAADAALWLSRSSDRILLADRTVVDACFKSARARSVGRANRIEWFLIEGQPEAACIARGRAAAAISYAPP